MVRSFESQGRAFAVSGRAINPVPVTRIFVDSFEDGDLSEYSGDTSNFSVVDAADETGVSAIHGDKVLKLPSTSGGEIASTSGLDNYFGKGEEMTAYCRVEGDNSVGQVYFRVLGLGGSDYWYVSVETANNLFRLWDNYDGSEAGRISTAPSTSTWYEFVIQQDDGSTFGGSDNDINVEVRDFDADSQVGTMSTNDSSGATNTGVGAAEGSINGDIYWDAYELTT